MVHGSPLSLHHCQYHSEEGVLGKSHPPLALPAAALDSSVIWESTKEAAMGSGGVRSSNWYLKVVRMGNRPPNAIKGPQRASKCLLQRPALQRADRRE